MLSSNIPPKPDVKDPQPATPKAPEVESKDGKDSKDEANEVNEGDQPDAADKARLVAVPLLRSTSGGVSAGRMVRFPGSYPSGVAILTALLVVTL
ncbi:MAG: hypothetical protein NVS3B21_00830 [Acidimicrobiales bacterium]